MTSLLRAVRSRDITHRPITLSVAATVGPCSRVGRSRAARRDASHPERWTTPASRDHLKSDFLSLSAPVAFSPPWPVKAINRRRSVASASWGQLDSLSICISLITPD